MSDDDPFGIGIRDGEIVGTENDLGHLNRWVNVFRGAWADGATRPHTNSVPGVPHIGRAATTAELNEILAMTATGNAYQYRRYLSSEESLGNLLNLDTPPLNRKQNPSQAKSFASDVLRVYDDTALDALVGGTDDDIMGVVKRTMTNFRELEWGYDPVSQTFNRQDGSQEDRDWNNELSFGTNRSKALQKQRGIVKGAIKNVLPDETEDRSALDVRIMNLLFQDIDNEDDILPLVDDSIQDHLQALLIEDYDTIRKMGTQLEYGDSGQVSNEFKKETYLEARDNKTYSNEGITATSAEFVRTHLTNSGDEMDVFTSEATLRNIGDDSFSITDGPNSFTNYRPETPIYQLNMSLSALRDKPETFRSRPTDPDSAYYPMRQRRARFEKLSVLHRLGIDGRYDQNPAVLPSVAHHLLRFSLMRARHSAALRTAFFEEETTIGSASEFGNSVRLDLSGDSLDDVSLNDFLEPVSYPNGFNWFRPLQTPFDLGSIKAGDDPRLEQIGHSLRYLQALDSEELDHLIRGTLDLASHRFDAWVTSIATRRLADHRNSQGNWYQPKPTTYQNDSDKNVWADTDAYVPPSKMPDWPFERPETTADTDREHVETDDGGNDLVSQPSTSRVSPSVPLPESSAGIHVGAWGFVENLHPDESGDNGEFLHAPSLGQATTAGVLRGGHQAFENQDDGHLSAVDLSADRVRIAKQLLDGVREGQPLGALLGYRFERGLHEANQQEYIQEFRQAYPTFTGTLGGPDSSSEAARSDVVDGYKLYRSLTFDDATCTIDPRPPRRPDTEERPETPSYSEKQAEHGLPSLSKQSSPAITGALWHLFEAIDAVRDVLTAESVHQFTQGNYSRAKASLEALAAGGAVPEPQVIDTPRTSVGLTHRLMVAFGDTNGASTPVPWQYDTMFTHPNLPAVGPSDGDEDGDETALAVPAVDDGHLLQARQRAEPNLNAWVGELLPDPADVGCEAAYRWTEKRDFATGTFQTPNTTGRVSVTDIGFEPDVIVFSASAAADDEIENDDGDGSNADMGSTDGVASTVHGWSHGSAKRENDGGFTQRSIAAVYDTGAGRTVGTADTDDALHVAFDGTGTESVRASVTETTTDGFEFDVTVEGEDRPLTVQFLALTVTDPGLVEIGHLETPTSDHSESLDIDADTVFLTATDAVSARSLDAQESITQATTGTVGISHGHAIVGENGVTQHALSLSDDPGGSVDPTATAHDDRVIHLPGDCSLACTGLGTTLDFSVASAGETARPVTYIAIESPPDEPTPEVGVLEDGENVLESEFRPGAVEFLALPGISQSDLAAGTAVSLSDAAVGFGHGLAAGLGSQRTLADGIVADGTVVLSAETGAVVSVPTDTSATTTVKWTGISDGGFSVEFTDGAPENCLVLYRAWPANPVEREFVVGTTLSFDELRLSPLDVLAFSKESADTAQTQLEQCLAFYLRRNRATKQTNADGGHPPIPGDTAVELRFQDDGGSRVSVADFLELVRTIRDTIADGRPATADDFAHPAEQVGPGYDARTVSELSTRASVAAESFTDVTALVDNRVELLNTDRDPTEEKSESIEIRDTPNVCEQVDDVQDAVTAFQAQAPISGISEACKRVEAASAGDTTVLESELDRLLRALPAGPTDPQEFDETLTVEALTCRTIRGKTDLSEKTPITVKILGTTNADSVATGRPTQFSVTRSVETDERGSFTVDIDCHDCTPGAPFLVAAESDDRVVFSEMGRIVEPQAIHVLDPGDEGGSSRDLICNTSVESEMPVTVTVESDHARDEPTAFDTTASTTTLDDGTFGVTVDVTDVQVGTAFTVTATDRDGEEVYSADGYVRDPAYDTGLRDVLDDLTVVPRLLWLVEQQGVFDPTMSKSPANVLQTHLQGNETDWNTISAEIGLIESWKASVDARENGSEAPGRPQIDVSTDEITVLDALEQLKDMDLRTLAESLSSALVPITAAGVDNVFDQTGGENRIDDARFWPTVDPTLLVDTRTALAQLLRNPAGRTYDADVLQYSPEFAATVDGIGTGVIRRVFGYLDLLFVDPVWAVETFETALNSPVEFLGRLWRFVAYPESFDAADRTALDRDFSALEAYFRRLDGLPGLRHTLERAKAFAEVLNRDDVRHEMDSENYDITIREAEAILELLDRSPHIRSEAEFERVLEQLEEPLSELNDIDHIQGTERPFERLVDAVDEFQQRVKNAEPWTRFERFEEQFEDLDPIYTADGQESDDATAVTEFIAVLDELQQAIDEFESRFRNESEAPVFQPSVARNEFSEWWESTAGTIHQEITLAVEPLTKVTRSTQLDRTFRRCVLETLRVPLLRASYFGVYASTPQSVTGGTPEDERTLVAQARGVSNRLHQRLDEAVTHEDAVADLVQGAADHDAAITTLSSGSVADSTVVDAAEHELARLESLFDESFVVLPPLSPPNQAELSKTFAASHTSELLSTAGPMETETWLQRTARVRDRPANLQRALSYAEMVSERLFRDGFRVGQLPYQKTDDWVGIDGLDAIPERGRVSMVTTFASMFHEDHPVAPSPGDPDDQHGTQISGFLVDDWRESIPTTEETTGVAVNYDDPSTEPPQSILLAVPPDGGDAPWSTDTLVRTILESVDLAKMRGVDLNVIGKPRNDPKRPKQNILGRLLPALTFPHNTRDVPDTPTVDFDLDRSLSRDLDEAANGGDDE